MLVSLLLSLKLTVFACCPSLFLHFCHIFTDALPLISGCGLNFCPLTFNMLPPRMQISPQSSVSADVTKTGMQCQVILSIHVTETSLKGILVPCCIGSHINTESEPPMTPGHASQTPFNWRRISRVIGNQVCLGFSSSTFGGYYRAGDKAIILN